MKLSELIKEFVELKSAKGPRSRKTASRYLITLRIFCLCMQDPLLEDLELSHVLWYLMETERLGWKPNGRNLIALAIRKLIEYANLRGYRTFNEQLIPLPEKSFSIPRVANIESFKKLLDQIPVKTNNAHYIRNRAILPLLWDTGARVGEILSLNINDLDLKKCTAIILTEKNRGRRPVRQIFWTKETNNAIKTWLKKLEEIKKDYSFGDDEALFVSISKSPQTVVRGTRMTDRGVAEIMRVLSNRAGLPVVTNAHSLRHAMGRDVKKVLRADSSVSNILGHSSIESSYIYSMLFGEDLREEWNKVTRKRQSIAPKKAANFPAVRRDNIRGQIRPVSIRTSKYGKYTRS